MEGNEPKKNLNAIMFGFLLVMLVSGIFILKSYFSDQNNESGNSSANQDQIEQKINSISAEDLNKKINSKEKITVLDIRDLENFEYEHILDSRRLPLENLESELGILGKSNEYVIADDLGLTPNEVQLMQIMKDYGFENVACLEGGFSAWKDSFYPTVTIGDPNSIVDQSKVSYVSSEDLKSFLDSQKDTLQIVDLRNSSSFDQDHIEGAINIRLDDLEKERSKIVFGRKVVLYGENKVQAFQGAARLFDMGIGNVYALSEGFKEWKEKGF